MNSKKNNSILTLTLSGKSQKLPVKKSKLSAHCNRNEAEDYINLEFLELPERK